jgi:hypothetical protein
VAREELRKLETLFEEAVDAVSSAEEKAEIRRRAGQRVRELRGAVEELERSAEGEGEG